MDSQKVIKRDKNCVLPTYNRNPIVLEKGHGLYAEGPEGQSYLDFTSGIGVNTLGYCDLAWAEAVSKQAHKLQHASNLYYTAPCGKLAKRLCQRTGMSRVFFANSGAEANEGAIKAARKYSFDHYGSDRYQIITLVNSFHGRTLATLTATGQGTFHQYFGPFNEGFTYTQAGDIEGLTELVDRHTCAILLELVQGEGGVMALDPEYVQAVRQLCDERDLVLIVDEVQTGVGRTGSFLCCEHYRLQPDIVTLAKGLAEEDPAIKLHVIGVVFVSDIPPALGLDANPYESAPPLVIQPDLYKKLVEAALDREKDDMKQAIGGLLDGMLNDVDIAAVNAPSPVDGINDFAKEHGCDLIVMGSRGLGVLRGMLGSVSYGVLRSADVPVLIAKEAEKE